MAAGQNINHTTDNHYAFDFIEWGRMREAAADQGIGEQRQLLWHYPDHQDLLIIMQPVDADGSYNELGYVTPDQLRDALRLAELLPETVE